MFGIFAECQLQQARRLQAAAQLTCMLLVWLAQRWALRLAKRPKQLMTHRKAASKHHLLFHVAFPRGKPVELSATPAGPFAAFWSGT